MAQGTVLTLLPQSPHPGPEGSSQTLVGNKQQAASYILANRNLQTITWNLQYNCNNPNPPQCGDVSPNNNFIGTIHIEASLVDDPKDGNDCGQASDWFKVYDVPTTTVYDGYYNLVGNYVWLRAKVKNWTQGAIYLVSVSY
jgi:hypothetical protein